MGKIGKFIDLSVAYCIEICIAHGIEICVGHDLEACEAYFPEISVVPHMEIPAAGGQTDKQNISNSLTKLYSIFVFREFTLFILFPIKKFVAWTH